MEDRPARDRFLALLRQFVFFHLGSDAEMTVHAAGEGLEIRVRHQRVHPLHLDFSAEEIQVLADDRGGFEERLLGDLTRHRRA